MKKWSLLTIAMITAAACAGTDAGPGVNNGENSTPNNSNPNSAPNNGEPNSTTDNGHPNSSTNNANPNSTTNNANPNSMTNNGTSNSTTNNGTSNNTSTEWRALVANAEIAGSTSSWTIVVFDGTAASTTVPQEFGSGALAVAASGDRGYVVDLNDSMALVIDTATGTEIETIDLDNGELDAVAASNGTLVAASGNQTRIAQYSGAGGGLGNEIPINALTGGDPLFIRTMAMDGDLIAGISAESSQFPNPPKVFLADASTASLIDLDPGQSGTQGLGMTGLTRLDNLGERTFAVATEFDGVKILREAGGNWVMDDTLIDAFGSAEVENVIMADEQKGLALTYDSGFQAFAFDASDGSTTPVDGLAVPSGLIGGDASADGAYYFVGDYGVRDEPDSPWGVGIVDTDGNLLDHVRTDEDLPPASIVAFD